MPESNVTLLSFEGVNVTFPALYGMNDAPIDVKR
jgi:hypothetical protein